MQIQNIDHFYQFKVLTKKQRKQSPYSMCPYKSLVHKNTATRLLKAKIEFNSKEKISFSLTIIQLWKTSPSNKCLMFFELHFLKLFSIFQTFNFSGPHVLLVFLFVCISTQRKEYSTLTFIFSCINVMCYCFNQRKT